ncbi:uncharacterized protein AB9X84_005210 [Acanthopagrus schlegelii]
MASQSSTFLFDGAEKAIDGSRDTLFSCSGTLVGFSHWWSLSLPDMYRINSVTITNKADLLYRMTDVEILIGNFEEDNGNKNPICAVISYIPSAGTHTFNCGGMIGRFVNLKLDSLNPLAALMVCEVEVYGELVVPAPSFSTVVMGRNVTVVEKKLCWSDALFYCRDLHWDLLSIRSKQEQREVEEALKKVSFPLTHHVWFGRRRYLMAGTWFWMSGASETYDYWERNSFWGETSPCGAIATSAPFKWNDLPCGEHLHFICLKDYQSDKKRVEFYSTTRRLTQLSP